MKTYTDWLKPLPEVLEVTTGDKAEYQKFFNKTLKKYGVTEPDKLSSKDKKKFYDEIDAGWKADDEVKESVDDSINESSYTPDMDKALAACEGNSLMSCGTPLEKAFGKKSVTSLGMLPGFLVTTKDKRKLVVTSSKNVDVGKDDATTKNGKIAIGYM